MTGDTDAGRVVDLRNRALSHLDAHGIAATPENYAFWFAYAEGRCPELNRAVDGLIAQGRPITVDGLADAYARFSASAAAGEPLRRVDQDVASGLDTLLQLLGEMAGNVRDFGASLQMADRKLAGDRTGPDVQALTGLLLEACRRSMLRNAQIEQQLEASRRKVAVLQEEVVSLGREATTDVLTGLMNRRAFDSELAKLAEDARRTGVPLSLILGDLDGFKQFNDTHGHQLGDQVLKFTGQTMQSLARDGDVMCRYGGEEFALLLPGTDLQAATHVAERLRKAIHEKVITKRGTGERLGRVSMSFGVAQFTRDGSGEMLVRVADQRLYASKQSGRNRVTPSLDSLQRTRTR